MLNNRKMIVADYDGTFFIDEEGIKKNINKVNEYRQEGNIFIIATGNNFKHFQEVILKYNIKYDYLILDQGATIFDNSGKLLKFYCLNSSILKEIINEIKQKNKNYRLCNQYQEIKTLEEENITKIAADFIDLEEANEFANKINQKFGKYVNAYTMIFKAANIVEIISSETDKKEAIEYIINNEKIDKENVYTIGNGYNDISMIKSFNGYCIKNSVQELLKECPNQVDSVAELIEKIM